MIVTPEYNHGYPAPIKNALDYLFAEWQHKPVGLVSYGAVAGGVRAAQSLKPVLQYLKLLPVSESVIIPFVSKHIADGAFTSTARDRRLRHRDARRAGPAGERAPAVARSLSTPATW